MRVVVFCHSLVSCWNHGNAHFLRGIASELVARGHRVDVFEPAGGWSRSNLVRDHGERALALFASAYPQLRSEAYDPATIDLDRVLEGADLVLVHEWNDHDLVRRIGQHRAGRGDYVLLFHDSHHRSVTDIAAMSAYDLSSYDGVLAFGDVVRDRYLAHGWARRAFTWHEAADTRVFFPHPPVTLPSDLVWIGNWGDEERTAELDEFLIEPVRRLGLRADVYGVRFPAEARAKLAAAGIRYGGWLPNHGVPKVFARHAVTVHVPRRPYVEQLPGIPTIRVFEALACGIPLVSARWHDSGGLFEAGRDFLVARDGDEMTAHLSALLSNGDLRSSLAAHGLRAIRRAQTCAHRVDELLAVYDELASGTGLRAAGSGIRASRSGVRPSGGVGTCA